MGAPCAYCGQPLTKGNFGTWCKPCYIAYKEKQKQTPQAPQTVSNEGEMDLLDQRLKRVEEDVKGLIGALIVGTDKEEAFDIHRIPLVDKQYGPEEGGHVEDNQKSPF